MTVRTVQLERGQIEALRQRLLEEGFELRPLAHGFFQARGPGVVVNAYRSGKVVVQGKAALSAAERFLPPGAGKEELDPRLRGPAVGSDEAGKGDYFGPLVVAAVGVAGDRFAELLSSGVRDSKAVTDRRAVEVDELVRATFPHAVVEVPPVEYNRRYEQVRNLNALLVDLHVHCIIRVLAAVPVRRVVVDRFGAEAQLARSLAERGWDVELHQVSRAERHPAVAAASVLARAAFLRALERLGEEVGVRLPKGGANRAVLEAGRAVLARGGRRALRAVAKLHFRTTRRLEGGVA